MEKEVEDFIIEKSNELLAAPMSCPEAKAAAKKWLAAVGTKKEEKATAAYFKELKEDVTSIDDLCGFAASPYAEEEFGKEGAAKFLAHAKAIKAAGAKYCDCPACSAAAAILSREKDVH
jgi:predicted GNAT family acetyltransferase